MSGLETSSYEVQPILVMGDDLRSNNGIDWKGKEYVECQRKASEAGPLEAEAKQEKESPHVGTHVYKCARTMPWNQHDRPGNFKRLPSDVETSSPHALGGNTGKRRWTEEEEAILRKLAKAMTPWTDIATCMGRSWQSCRQKFYHMGDSLQIFTDDSAKQRWKVQKEAGRVESGKTIKKRPRFQQSCSTLHNKTIKRAPVLAITGDCDSRKASTIATDESKQFKSLKESPRQHLQGFDWRWDSSSSNEEDDDDYHVIPGCEGATSHNTTDDPSIFSSMATCDLHSERNKDTESPVLVDQGERLIDKPSTSALQFRLLNLAEEDKEKTSKMSSSEIVSRSMNRELASWLASEGMTDWLWHR